MITTWINQEEQKHYSSVEDKELNEVFQEVRERLDKRFLIQTVRYDRRTLWQRLISDYRKNVGNVYALYMMTGTIDAQVINFAPIEGTWSINTSVTKGQLMTYFFGLLGGYDYAMRPKEKVVL